METQENRVKLVKWALRMTKGTQLAPCQYELSLLEQFVQGLLTIEEVIALLEGRAGQQQQARPPTYQARFPKSLPSPDRNHKPR